MPETSQAGQQNAEQEGLTRTLFDKGTLVHLYIGRWTGNRKMHERDLLIEELDKSAMYIGHKKLLPKAAQERLQWLEGQARNFLAGRSISFPIGGARFVYFRALAEVREHLRRLKADWDVAVEDLVTNYPRFMEEQLARLDAQAHKLAEDELEKIDPDKRRDRRMALREWEEEQHKKNRALYPPTTELRNHFTFEWRMFQIGTMDSDPMSALDADEIQAERERIRNDLRQWVTQATVQMHRELGEAAAQARRLLEENGKLNPKNLKPLFDSFETFQSVNFAGSSQFQGVIDQIRSRYLVRNGAGDSDYRLSSEIVNNSTRELTDMLGTISQLAIADVAEQAGIGVVRTGEFQRFIEM